MKSILSGDRFLDSELSEIRERVSVEGIVGQVRELKPAYGRLICCCPLHDERTPSFFVYPDQNSWHCFGCNQGGDVIALYQRMYEKSFPEAVRDLALDAGVLLECDKGKRPAAAQPTPACAPIAPKPSTKPAEVQETTLTLPRWQAVLQARLDDWTRNLLSDDPHAVRARGFLAGRGFDESAIRHFRLGLNLKSVCLPLAPGELIRGKKWLWVPAGLTIPVFDARGQLVRVKVRTDAALDANVAERGKYLSIPRPAAETDWPLVRPRLPIRPTSVCLTEGELDAMVLSLHGGCYAIPVGSRGRLNNPAMLLYLHNACERIAVVVDNEPLQRDRKTGKIRRHESLEAAERAGLQDSPQLNFVFFDHKDPCGHIESHGLQDFQVRLEEILGPIEFTSMSDLAAAIEDGPFRQQQAA